ncbi:hypothetical protein Tco_0682874 [Tanacetum coccineum]|uniref:Uncharacterized protein n=1 Tax=Tanacetum coccineum TaxID=301880 RepID=A0ABQ4XSM6_9ASTR
MFEVSIILKEYSAELVYGGANGFVKVSLSNTATSSLYVCLTFVELIGEDVVSLFGEVLRGGASLSMEVEEDAPGVSDGSRVAAKMGVDTTFKGGLADVDAAWLSTSPELMCQEVNL